MAIAHPAAAVPREQDRAVDHAAPGTAAVGALVTVAVGVAVVLLYALWKFWPTDAILKNAGATPVRLFGFQRLVTPDVRLLVVVALCGALGGLMHSTRSLAWYAGHQGLKWRWVPYYLVTIVIGAGLASIFYLVIRGGVLGDKATTADANPYGFAGIAALVGLFTEQALEMLRRVANQVFALAPQGADAVTTSSSATTTVSSTTDATTTTGAATGLAATTGAASNVTATTATLEGDVTPNGDGTQYFFDWGTSTSYGELTAAQAADATASHVTADLNGLVPDTEYHFRLVVADAGGAWTVGDDATFRTAAA